MSNANPNGYVDQPGSQNLLGPNSQNSASYQSGYNNGQANLSNQGTAAPTTWINNQGVAPVNPNSYQYGGQRGGAAAQNQYYQGLAGAQAAQQGAQIDTSQYNPTLQQLSGFYSGQMNGTGPSLAAQQARSSMDQSLQAQMAAANSARGGLSGSAAQMQAAQQGAAAQQAAAQQSVQGRIAEEYNAAQGMQGVGQMQEQGALSQAQLQQQQQDINAKAALGWGGLENQVNTEQMNAQMQQQAQMSQNYQAASGQGMQQGQFNTQQGNNMLMGGIEGAAALGLLFADADFVEPDRMHALRESARAHHPAWLTLREEGTVDGDPFLALADRNTGRVKKVATEDLSPAEARRVAEPHGAGPIFAQGAARAHTTFHDMPMAAMPRPMPAGMPSPMMPARSTLGPRGMAPMPTAGGAPMMQPNRPAPMPGGGMMAPRPMPVGMMAPRGAPPPGGMMLAQPMARAVPDMDLSAARHRTYHDAGMGDPAMQGQLAGLDYGQMVAPPGAGGGTFADQIRAQEAARIQSGTPQGGYTFAQQQYYPGAGGLGTQPGGISSDQAAQAFGGNGPSAGALAGSAVATGGYDRGWDHPIAAASAAPQKDNGPIPESKMRQASADLLKAGVGRMGSTQPSAAAVQNYGGLAGSAGFQPMQVSAIDPFADVDLGGAMFPTEMDRMYGLLGSARIADMDLGDPGMMPSIPHAANAMSPVGSRPPPGAVTAGVAGLQDHMRRLQAADADLKSRARLGSGARFSHLEHSLAARPGVHDAGALAAAIGRKAHPHTFQHFAAAGRK